MEPTSTDRTDRALLVEIGMVLALLVLTILLYWRPVAGDGLSPRWWHWFTLGLLFFGVVALHTWRKKHRSHNALHRVMRDDRTDHESAAGTVPSDLLEKGPRFEESSPSNSSVSADDRPEPGRPIDAA